MVSVIVAAHNEGACIAARIENLLALDYPPDRLEIIVGSDGSTDDTVTRARRYEDKRVHVKAFSNRRGKPALLNRLVPQTLPLASVPTVDVRVLLFAIVLTGV